MSTDLENLGMMGDNGEGFVVNFGDIRGPELIPDGDYIARIARVTPGTSKAGNKKWDLQWKIETGDHRGRVVFDTLTFTQSAMFRVRDVFVVTGAAGSDFSGGVTPAMLQDKIAIIRVTSQASSTVNPETGQVYEPRNTIKRYAAVDNDLMLEMFRDA